MDSRRLYVDRVLRALKYDIDSPRDCSYIVGMRVFLEIKDRL